MESKSRKKMIIVGLDNAGKTTIILTMKKKLGPHNFTELEPTRGLQTEEFETVDGVTYHIWDFGGQEAYREKYLQKPGYFGDTDSCTFVLDIQDKSRYTLALEYLQEILKILKELGENCDFSVYLHKFDPELVDSDEYQKRSEDLRIKLREIFKTYTFPLKFFHTSIYTVFQKIQVK
ncbi:MAG: ADP-ribosylation factor-like protein [Promethearchaeota archaeon]